MSVRWRSAAALTAGVVLLLVSACREPTERPLTARERQEVSQRYADTVRLLTPIVDSLCEAGRPALVAAYVDSMYASRVAELQRQRKPAAQ